MSGTLTVGVAIIAPLGSVAAPALTFTGDTNTGVYSPGADQLAVATGGVQRIGVSDTGDVQVGYNAYSGLRYLDVANADTDSGSGSILRLITTNVAGTKNVPVNLVKYKNGLFAITNVESDPAACITLGVGGSENVRFTSTGLLGVGTPVPAISSGVGIHSAGSTFRLAQSRTPSSSTATGNTGEICWDSSYFYCCVATNTWRRSLHSTW
jgi:hypothetical protein